MSVSKSYPRPAAALTVVTAMAIKLKVAELPGVPVEIPASAGAVDAADTAIAAASGTTGNLSAVWTADADESGGTDVQNLFKLTAAIALANSADAKPILTVTVTPVSGAAGGTDLDPQVFVVTHPETMDAWQLAAGRVRQ